MIKVTFEFDTAGDADESLNKLQEVQDFIQDSDNHPELDDFIGDVINKTDKAIGDQQND